MIIEIDNNIVVECWESGTPYWCHIKQGEKSISFSHTEINSVIRALKSIRERLRMVVQPENEKP